MQVKRTEDTDLYTIITVKPWPADLDAPWVSVIWFKESPIGPRDVRVGMSAGPGMPHDRAFQFAQAILRACDIARRLEEEGAILLEGEEGPTRTCVSCEKSIPTADTLDFDGH